MAPALAMVMEASAVAKNEIDRIEREIDARHEMIKKLQNEQDVAVAKVRDFQVEYRAYERLISAVTPSHYTSLQIR